MKRSFGLGLLLWALVHSAGATTTDVAELTFDSHCLNLATATNPVPGWIQGIEQTDGQFNDALKCWSVDAAAPTAKGRLSIAIDRSQMAEDLALGIVFDQATNSDFVVQLLDAQDRVIVLDLFGNIMQVSADAKTDTFIVPMRQFPSATKIAIRRVNGDLKVYGAVLYPVVLRAEADKETEESLAKLFGDSLSPENPIFKRITAFADKRGGTQQWVIAQTSTSTISSQPPTHEQRLGDGWAVLPYYEDSDWSGARGAPAVVGRNDILLQGNPVRSISSYSLPATIDCDIMLEERAASDGAMELFVIPAGLPMDRYPKPMTNLRVIYSNTGDYGSVDRLDLNQIVAKGGNQLVWSQPHKYSAGTVYHVRMVLGATGALQLFINGQKQPTPANLMVPYRQFQIQAGGWQPTNRWHLRNVIVQ